MGESSSSIFYYIQIFYHAKNVFSIHTLIKDDQEPIIMSKYNDYWIEKELPTNENGIHTTLDWYEEKFNKTTLTINHVMLPFLLLLENTESSA